MNSDTDNTTVSVRLLLKRQHPDPVLLSNRSDSEDEIPNKRRKTWSQPFIGNEILKPLPKCSNCGVKTLEQCLNCHIFFCSKKCMLLGFHCHLEDCISMAPHSADPKESLSQEKNDSFVPISQIMNIFNQDQSSNLNVEKDPLHPRNASQHRAAYRDVDTTMHSFPYNGFTNRPPARITETKDRNSLLGNHYVFKNEKGNQNDDPTSMLKVENHFFSPTFENRDEEINNTYPTVIWKNQQIYDDINFPKEIKVEDDRDRVLEEEFRDDDVIIVKKKPTSCNMWRDDGNVNSNFEYEKKITELDCLQNRILSKSIQNGKNHGSSFEKDMITNREKCFADELMPSIFKENLIFKNYQKSNDDQSCDRSHSMDVPEMHRRTHGGRNESHLLREDIDVAHEIPSSDSNKYTPSDSSSKFITKEFVDFWEDNFIDVNRNSKCFDYGYPVKEGEKEYYFANDPVTTTGDSDDIEFSSLSESKNVVPEVKCTSETSDDEKADNSIDEESDWSEPVWSVCTRSNSNRTIEEKNSIESKSLINDTQKKILKTVQSRNETKLPARKWKKEVKKINGMNWKFLEHKGPLFAPPYERLPKDVKFFYEGKEIRLSREAEEIATLYSHLIDNEITKTKKFNKNFLREWRKAMKPKEREIITDLSKCNFRPMHQYFRRKSLTLNKFEKRIKEEEEALIKAYGICTVDGVQKVVENFRIDGPGLICDSGTKTGTLKRRIVAEDVIINCSKDSKVPVPPRRHKWKEVRHDNTVSWLASWRSNTERRRMCYMSFSPS